MFSPHWIVFLALACLSACGGPEEKKEPPPPPTKVELSIKTGANINPDADNRPSPLLVRVYELKDIANFSGADFFALYSKEQETLGGDLVRKQEFMFVPNETRRLEFEAESATRFLAIFAAFRTLETARWRASAGIPTAQTTIVEVTINGDQVALEAKQKPVEKPSEEEE